jgi:hypothetical protein
MFITVGNVFIDSSFVPTGMILLGKFYGLGRGMLFVVDNLLSQNLQTPPALPSDWIHLSKQTPSNQQKARL